METRQVPASELKGGGYLALPDGNGPHPGVVVIHEAYGLNDHIKDVTRRFAAAGYVGLGVDLFGDRNRAVCMARFMAGMLRGSVHRFGIDDLKDSLTYLSGLPQVDPKRVGAIGFCMGGTFAIAWACTDARLKAIAPFYAFNPRPMEAVKRLCPVVGSYPGSDLTAGAGRALEKALAEHSIVHDIRVYPGARHSFFNDTARVYDASAAQDSWGRVLAFFGEKL